MSLAAGPGRGGLPKDALPGELELYINQHIKYIQTLDTVRTMIPIVRPQADADLAIAQR